MPTNKCIICGKPVEKKSRKYCAVCKKTAMKTLKPVACAYCGSLFQPKTATSKFCTMQCKNKAHSQAMRDDGNPRFIDGSRGYPVLFVRMVPHIYERDSGRCSLCSGVAELQVHHIDGNIACNDPSNLIMLCRSCHTKSHKSEPTASAALKLIAEARSSSMTSKWKETTTSLLTEYSSTIA